MIPKSVRTRDAGLALISRVNRWMVGGAVGLTAVISIAAAHANHGRTVGTSSATAAAASPAPQSPTPSSAGGGGLQQPASAPSAAPAPATPAPAPAPTPAVSGGS
jgi:hypothetical protein